LSVVNDDAGTASVKVLKFNNISISEFPKNKIHPQKLNKMYIVKREVTAVNWKFAVWE